MQEAHGLPAEQNAALAVQRVAHPMTEMPVILYNEHGQALIQPYTQMTPPQYEVSEHDRLHNMKH